MWGMVAKVGKVWNAGFTVCIFGRRFVLALQTTKVEPGALQALTSLPQLHNSPLPPTQRAFTLDVAALNPAALSRIPSPLHQRVTQQQQPLADEPRQLLATNQPFPALACTD